MAFDAHGNFVVSTVAVAPAPATTGLSLTVQSGDGALFPVTPFNCTVNGSGVPEIVRVTGITHAFLEQPVNQRRGLSLVGPDGHVITAGGFEGRRLPGVVS